MVPTLAATLGVTGHRPLVGTRDNKDLLYVFAVQPDIRERRDLVMRGVGAFAAVVVPLLIYAWLDLTLTEAWITPARWLRFPAVLLLALPFHIAEEVALGPAMRTRLSALRTLPCNT